MTELPSSGARRSRFGPGFDPASLATADEVQSAMIELDTELMAVKGHLEAAVARYHADGTRGDPDWFRRAKGAVRAKAFLRQRLQERLGQLRRAEKAAAHAVLGAQIERRFVDAAKLMLPRETFDEIMRAAQRRAEAA